MEKEVDDTMFFFMKRSPENGLQKFDRRFMNVKLVADVETPHCFFFFEQVRGEDYY